VRSRKSARPLRSRHTACRSRGIEPLVDNNISGVWCRVKDGMLSVEPWNAGISQDSRFCLWHKVLRRYTVLTVIPSGGDLSFSIDYLPSASDFMVKLQTRSDGVWVDNTSLVPVDELVGLLIFLVRPSDWGIMKGCEVVLAEKYSGRESKRFALGPMGTSYVEVRTDYGRRTFWSCRFLEPDIGSAKSEADRLICQVRLYPVSELACPPRECYFDARGNEYSIRDEVVLAPRAAWPVKSKRDTPLDGTIVATASSKGCSRCSSLGETRENIAEAMEFVYGQQNYAFAEPSGQIVDAPDEEFVFAGYLHDGFGHFLLDSLSRAWYAVSNPNASLVWFGNGLSAWQQEILSLVGVGNRSIFVDRATSFAKMSFPFPGVAIGSYLTRPFADFLAAVPGSPRVEGKRLFISRSHLTQGFGSIDEGDEVLDALVETHGFMVYHPQEHCVADQLKEISSSEVVLGVEGSAMHSPLLLRDPIDTRFFALARHRAGAGVFGHIRSARPDLSYRTIDVNRTKSERSQSDRIDLDLAQMDDLLRATGGLMENLELLAPYYCDSDAPDIDYPQTIPGGHIAHCKGRSTQLESDMARALWALPRTAEVFSILGRYL